MNINWKYYTELNFDNTSIGCYNIDTRDFYGSEGNFEYKIDNFEYVLNHTEKYLYSKEKVISILDRLFTESGGQDLEDEWSENNPQQVNVDDMLFYLDEFDIEYALGMINDYGV